MLKNLPPPVTKFIDRPLTNDNTNDIDMVNKNETQDNLTINVSDGDEINRRKLVKFIGLEQDEIVFDPNNGNKRMGSMN